MQIVMKGYNLDHFKKKDIYEWDEIIGIIEEMESKIHTLNLACEELERDIEDNYKPISHAEQAGYSERDFI